MFIDNAGSPFKRANNSCYPLSVIESGRANNQVGGGCAPLL